jgi:hypothetical protein
MNLEVIPGDTTPEAARVHLEIVRRMPASRRLELALGMSNSLRKVVAAGVRHRHPEFSPDQVRLGVIRLTLGDKLFREVFSHSEVQV